MAKVKKINKKTLLLFKKVVGILKPPEQMSVAEWADKNRKLSQESSAEPGQWVTDRAPYQRGIMDAAGDSEVETVVIMSSSQVGKTEIINNVIGYYIEHDPAPMMLVMPTVDLAKTWSKKRFSPMLRDTPVLRDKISESKSRDSDNTILEKGFPGGYIAIVGANSPVGLSSRPIRVLLADEVDRFPASAGIEGDPLALAEKRTKTFWNKKKIFVSTPTVKNVSRIEKEYENSSKEKWCLPCPVCGKYQPLEWSRLDFKTELMSCRYCRQNFSEFDWKTQKGKWIAENEEEKKVRGFHLNALASPWENWGAIIDEFLKAKKGGKETLQTFINTYLGETWELEQGESNDEEGLLKRLERFDAEVPDGALILTAGVDVQDDRFEIEVVGWGIDHESYGIQYATIYGNLDKTEIWSQLDEFLMKTYSYADGRKAKIMCICVDSGGHFTQEVYKFCKPKQHRRIYAIKGKGGVGIPYVGKPSKNNREKTPLFILGVDAGKEKLYSRLKITTEGAGYCHFSNEKWRNYDKDYFKGLCSEKRMIKMHKGKPKIEWIKKSGVRNEPLDLRNYATAAIEILNPNFEMLSRYKLDGEIYENKPKKKKGRRQLSKGV